MVTIETDGTTWLTKKDVLRLQEAVEKHLSLRKDIHVSIAFVSEKKIQELNREYRGKNYVTDVLSFAMDPEPGQKGIAGDVLICHAQAKRQAKEQGHAVKNEVLFLAVHGILHLAGQDHETQRQRTRMFALQEKILNEFGISISL